VTARRALAAVALLCGFYVLALSMVSVPVTLLATGAFADVGPRGLPLVLPLVSGLLFLPSLLAGCGAVLDGMRVRHQPPDDSTAVIPSAAPPLWALVAELATVIGTRQPTDIRLTADPSVSVFEESRFLGLMGGRRYLNIGVPVLSGLTVGELRAVLAHELGHFARGHTRMSPVVVRGDASVRSAVTRFSQVPGLPLPRIPNRVARDLVARLAGTILRDERNATAIAAIYLVNWVFGRILLRRAMLGYARFFTRVTREARRKHEDEADIVALRIAGTQQMRSALRKCARLDLAWANFSAGYLAPAVSCGSAPADVFAAFGDMLADDDVRRMLDAAIEELERSAGPARDDDTHPPLRDRIARAGSEPEVVVVPDDRPGTDLLGGQAAALARWVQAASFPQAGLGLAMLPVPEWKGRAAAAVAAALADQFVRVLRWLYATERVGASPITVERVLAEMCPPDGPGLLARITAAGAVTVQDPDPWLRACLHALIGSAIAAQGQASWQLSWTGPSVLACASLTDAELRSLAELAADRPGGAEQVSAWLVRRGLDPRRPVRVLPPAAGAPAAGHAPGFRGRILGYRRQQVDDFIERVRLYPPARGDRPVFDVAWRGYDRNDVKAYLRSAGVRLGSWAALDPGRAFRVTARGYDRHAVDEFIDRLPYADPVGDWAMPEFPMAWTGYDTRQVKAYLRGLGVGNPPPAGQPAQRRRRTLVGPVYSGGVQIADFSTAPRWIRYLLYTGLLLVLASMVSMLVPLHPAGHQLAFLGRLASFGTGVMVCFAATILAMLARLLHWLRTLRTPRR
jgi:Zn-dependent protease with chaperone function